MAVTCLAVIATVLIGGTSAVAQKYKVLYDFNCTGTNGCEPNGELVFDGAGNIYGTTVYGGSNTTCSSGCGTVFKLSPKKTAGWIEKTLHSFDNNGIDGFNPAAGVIVGRGNKLYGTTPWGGAYGEGAVFELSPDARGEWTETVLHSFQEDGSDGMNPEAGLFLDSSGNLYGTTSEGGTLSKGTAFELTPTDGGAWQEAILYTFGDLAPRFPRAGLTANASGALYGTTYYGGNYDQCSRDNAGFGCGTAYELMSSGGSWTVNLQYSFGNGSDGYYPDATLVSDAAGNLYGTTPYGGANSACQYLQLGNGCGMAFELSPSTDGSWTETVLHNFGTGDKDGTLPSGGLIMDKSGNLYGVTEITGVDYAGGYGTVFELSPEAGGSWKEKILHNFATTRYGGEPSGNLTLDSEGNVYGAAGVVFEITP
jgi:uncharacterized repeat protein (TIGR03803 family)